MLTFRRTKKEKLESMLRNHFDGPVINIDTIFMVVTVALIVGLLYVETGKASELDGVNESQHNIVHSVIKNRA